MVNGQWSAINPLIALPMILTLPAASVHCPLSTVHFPSLGKYLPPLRKLLHICSLGQTFDTLRKSAAIQAVTYSFIKS